MYMSAYSKIYMQMCSILFLFLFLLLLLLYATTVCKFKIRTKQALVIRSDTENWGEGGYKNNNDRNFDKSAKIQLIQRMVNRKSSFFYFIHHFSTGYTFPNDKWIQIIGPPIGPKLFPLKYSMDIIRVLEIHHERYSPSMFIA